MNLDEMIKYARGEQKADLLLTNASIVNVFSGEIIPGSIAIAGGYITGFGSYPAKKVVDIKGRFVAPGFIDAHVHIESSMSCPTEFARSVLPHGTTTVAAEYFGLNNVGAIAPGRQADMVVFSDIKNPVIEEVYFRGDLAAREGKILPEIKKPAPLNIRSSMNVDIDKIVFSIPAVSLQARVIEIIPDQLITGQSLIKVAVSGNSAVSDIKRDILKIAVVERHKGTGNTGMGFVRGFGLKQGALASSVAHDSHNIIIVGTNDEDMKTALKAVAKMGGGLAAASNGKILADIPLPIAGLMSLQPVKTIKEKLDNLIDISRGFGSSLNDPFMTLSFLALPVIPELKITDKGLVDVTKFRIVPLFVN